MKGGEWGWERVKAVKGRGLGEVWGGVWVGSGGFFYFLWNFRGAGMVGEWLCRLEVKVVKYNIVLMVTYRLMGGLRVMPAGF